MKALEFIQSIDFSTVDSIVTYPLIGLDEKNNIVSNYGDAINMEECDEDDPNIICWGVYIHRQGIGITCLFDVPDKHSADIAEVLLSELLRLK